MRFCDTSKLGIALLGTVLGAQPIAAEESEFVATCVADAPADRESAMVETLCECLNETDDEIKSEIVRLGQVADGQERYDAMSDTTKQAFDACREKVYSDDQ